MKRRIPEEGDRFVAICRANGIAARDWPFVCTHVFGEGVDATDKAGEKRVFTAKAWMFDKYTHRTTSQVQKLIQKASRCPS